MVRIACAHCASFDLCLECFSRGREISTHRRSHAYRVVDTMQWAVFEGAWTAEEEWLLLEGLGVVGMGNWAGVAMHVGGGKSPAECQRHYERIYMGVSDTSHSSDKRESSANNTNTNTTGKTPVLWVGECSAAKVLTREGIRFADGRPIPPPLPEAKPPKVRRRRRRRRRRRLVDYEDGD